MAKTRSFSLLKGFLEELRDHIVDNSDIWTDSCCQLSIWEDKTQYPQGTPLLFIIPQDFRSISEFAAGGGDQMTVLDGQINCRIIVLNNLDQIQSDFNAVTSTSTTLGIYELVDHLIGDLQMLDLCFATGSYLIEPMRVINVSKPTRDKDSPEWIYCDVKFGCRINQQISGVV